MNRITKKQQAIELYKENYNLPKEKLIKLFVNELNLPSENAARTYISLSKKRLAEHLNINYRARKIDSRKTKKGQAMELFCNNKSLTRKEMIALFVTELGMTEGSAATHCSLCTQEYTGSKHNAIT